MRKSTISHKYLREILAEIMELSEETPDETFLRFEAELKHSSLIIAGDVGGGYINIPTANVMDGKFALLFTDMDEFRKAFPGYEVESHENIFKVYYNMMFNSNLDGFIINIESECFILPKVGFEENEDMPKLDYSTEGSYTSEELKRLKDQINNTSLEEFIENPQNTGKYEELFDMMSSSTIMTMMLSREDLSSRAENGVISSDEQEPLGFPYFDKTGGKYATVYTSEEKMSHVNTPFNKYSQIVNFSYMVNFVLNCDMDGIVINPETDNMVLTRDVLLMFSPVLDKTCNDSKLNSAMFHMFLMEA